LITLNSIKFGLKAAATYSSVVKDPEGIHKLWSIHCCSLTNVMICTIFLSTFFLLRQVLRSRLFSNVVMTSPTYSEEPRSKYLTK